MIWQGPCLHRWMSWQIWVLFISVRVFVDDIIIFRLTCSRTETISCCVSCLGGNDLTGNIAFLCDIDDFEYDAGEFSSSACGSFSSQKDNIAKLYNDLNKDLKQIDPECEWDGITCNSNGAIVEIYLGELQRSQHLNISFYGFRLWWSITQHLASHIVINLTQSTADKSLDGSISTIIGELNELKRIDLSMWKLC